MNTDKSASDKPASVKSPRVDFVALVRLKYEAAGWRLVYAPSGSINDIIASKGRRLHFVQVISGELSLTHTGEGKNAFIQNAFSNGAIPVYAHVITCANGKHKFAFEDVNIGVRVVVGAPKKNNL